MIDGKQLRVSNVVYKRGEIITLDISEFANLWRTPLKYCAVNITHNILSGVGFIPTNSFWYRKGYISISLKGNCFISDDLKEIVVIPKRINCLHELQNLYFEVHNEELIYTKDEC